MKNTNENLVIAFTKAFNNIDFMSMSKCFADNLIAYITNDQGGVDKIEGSQEYLSRVKKMNPEEVNFRVDITQITSVSDELVLVMYEIHADKPTKKLHNFSAHLMKCKAGKISELWMVEALPQYSAEFWLG